MNPPLLARFLVGSRAAIVEVASSPKALLPAFLFVLSAGFAREYDGEDILRAPWHFLRPAGASLVTATVLFVIVHTLSWLRSNSGEGKPPPTREAFLRFLTVFWWTAPLAWLYAIPYERFLGSVEAMEVNLWTLALVAAWRVALMTRIVQVLYGFGPVHALVLVMLFADLVVVFVLMVVPLPVLDLMGGIRYSEQDMLLARVTFNLTVLTILASPVILLGSLITLLFARPTWMRPTGPVPMDGARRLGIVALIIWIPVLPFTQAEQRLRTRAERMIHDGRFEEALELLSEHEPGDFPPHWDPPPRVGFYPMDPTPLEVAIAVRDREPADWVRDLFLRKVEVTLLAPFEQLSWAGILESVQSRDQSLAPSAELAEVFREELTQLEVLEAHAGDRTEEDQDAIRGLILLRRAQLARAVEVE